MLSITSPESGATVSGTITVQASVTIIGALTVAGVQFKLDGRDLGSEDTSAPYAVSWDTTTAANGSHTLTAVARDSLGVRWTSDPVTVTVSNGPPPDTTPPTISITSPASGSTVCGIITVTASASDNVGVAGVQFMLDGAALGAEADTALIAGDVGGNGAGLEKLSARQSGRVHGDSSLVLLSRHALPIRAINSDPWITSAGTTMTLLDRSPSAERS